MSMSERITVVVQNVRAVREEWAKLLCRPDDPHNAETANWPAQRNITVVGAVADFVAGDVVEVFGAWSTHPRYGTQFDAIGGCRVLSANHEGLQAFLDQLPNIGRARARAIMAHFGSAEAVLQALETGKELTAIDGITEERAKQIVEAAAQLKAEREVFMQVAQLGLKPKLIAQVLKAWSKDSLEVLQSDPYTLMKFISFQQADEVARERFLIDWQDPRRTAAAVLDQIDKQHAEGHTWATSQHLAREFWMTPDVLKSGLEVLTRTTTLPSGRRIPARVKEYRNTWARAEVSRAERSIAANIRRLKRARCRAVEVQDEDVQGLAEAQAEAVRVAAAHPVSILTGGPGTGKTSTIKSMLEAFRRAGLPVRLCAPTGMAARRIQAQTGEDAMTIHRLLGIDPATGTWLYSEDNRLPAAVVVLDEASMVDVELFAALLSALPTGCRCVITGDVDQLPSIGPGRVLFDLLQSQVVPMTRLTENFRQRKESGHIITVAQDINRGALTPDITDTTRACALIPCATSAQSLVWIVQCTQQLLAASEPGTRVQVIAAQYSGEAGLTNLNWSLQAALNPLPALEDARVPVGGDYLASTNDVVVQTQNNYRLGVVNGEQGTVVAASINGLNPADYDASSIEDVVAEEEVKRPSTYKYKYVLVVDFSTQVLALTAADAKNVLLAYAISGHRAQGNEWPKVLIAVPIEHKFMLTRTSCSRSP
jgi:exodeoxyribonuclease V alpha subunit